VVFSQNHDQIGNRLQGERLTGLVGFEQLKLAAGVTLLSPFIPLIFMGEEYGETAPFVYFISHGDPELAAAVRDGRRREHQAFGAAGPFSDPQDEGTFLSARLNPARPRQDKASRALLDFYSELIRLRRRIPGLRHLSKKETTVYADSAQMTLFVLRGPVSRQAALLFHFSGDRRQVRLPLPTGRWRKALDSEDPRWLGGGGGPPAEIVSDGGVAVTAAPWVVLLWEAEGP
jgi:maltooligosyltrehalose trehalohydrolase